MQHYKFFISNTNRVVCPVFEVKILAFAKGLDFGLALKQNLDSNIPNTRLVLSDQICTIT